MTNDFSILYVVYMHDEGSTTVEVHIDWCVHSMVVR